jgi:hypothetical protein
MVLKCSDFWIRYTNLFGAWLYIYIFFCSVQVESLHYASSLSKVLHKMHKRFMHSELILNQNRL